mgnify:CR=1 FL=1
MPILEPITLVGRRCRLVPLGHEHDAPLAALQEAEHLQWMWRQHGLRTAEDRQRFTAWLLADPRVLALAVIDERPDAPEPGAVVGMTTYLGVDPEDRALEIGHSWLAPRYLGTGINTEMKYLMLRHAFETPLLPPVRPTPTNPFAPEWPEPGPAARVQLMTDARNARSRAAIEKIGATFEGVMRKHAPIGHGSFRDSALFSITDNDWARVKARLEQMLREA